MIKPDIEKVRLESVYARDFITRLESYFSEYLLDIKVVKMSEGYSVSLEVEDGTGDELLSISMVTAFNEVTVGHNFDDHEHFSQDIDGADFIEKAFSYINAISFGRERD